jgi:hypothetical protein
MMEKNNLSVGLSDDITAVILPCPLHRLGQEATTKQQNSTARAGLRILVSYPFVEGCRP